MITYNEFKRHLTDIVRINDLDDRLIAATCGTDAEIFFPSLISNVVDLLADATNDDEGWIEYWVYELNCGKEYKDGMVRAADENNIPLKTIQDLWNILQKGDEN